MDKSFRNWKSYTIEYWQYLPVIFTALILGFPFLFTGKVLFWGTVILQFIPWRHFAWSVLLSGHLPLWNPLVGMGAPLLANYQSALLYPPNWILYILDCFGGVSWLAWGQGLLVVFHWCLAGAGMIGLLRWLGMGKLGQAVGGVSFGLSSYLVGRASFLSINAAVAWLPWVILYVLVITHEIQYQRKPFRRSWITLVIVLTLQLLAGHAQTTWYTILLAFIWSGFWGYRFGRLHHANKINNCLINIGSVWLWLGGALITATIISAPQLFPTFEYLLQSQRSTSVDADIAMTYSFWPWRFITLFAPGMYGSPATGDYWGYGNYWEDALYVGLLPVILGIWFVIRGWKQSKGEPRHKVPLELSFVIFQAMMIIISMVLALGNRTQIFPWLYRNIPTFDMFQAPTRISIWVVFSLTLLSGVGIESIRRPEKKALYWTRLATAGAFAITLGASLVLVIIKDIAPTFIRAFALMGLFGMICGFIVLYAPRKDFTENQEKPFLGVLWKTGVLVFICLDLAVSNWGLNPGIDCDVVEKIAQPWENLVENGRIYISSETEYALKFDEFMRFDTFSPAVGWAKLSSVQIPNMSMLKRIESANNFDPLLPAGYAQWEDALNKEIEDGNTKIYTNMLNLMGVGVVEELSLTSNELVRYKQLQVPQRVRLVHCAIPVKNNVQAMTLISGNQIEVNEEVIIEGLSNSQEIICTASNSIDDNDHWEIIAENPNTVAIQTQSHDAGWLVLSDIWYPGWKVMVDGVEVTGYRANSLFRAVKLENGNHVVEFVYRPASFYIGIMASFVCILFLTLYMAYPWKKTTNH